MARLIETYHDKAAEKGVKIVPCCGFDSIPSDMGTFLVASHIKDKLRRCGRSSDCWISPWKANRMCESKRLLQVYRKLVGCVCHNQDLLCRHPAMPACACAPSVRCPRACRNMS